MGMYYSTTVGYGFEVPLENIQELGSYNGYAFEALEKFIYHFPNLSFTTANHYDASDEETTFVITIDRLTEEYDQNETFDLVVLDSTPAVLTTREELDILDAQVALGLTQAPIVQFVASSIS
jgi:hypothetical protein